MATTGLYKNEVVEQYVNEFLTTYVDLEGLCTVDNSLQGQEGDTVKIYAYTLSGQAADVTEGNAPSAANDISISGAYESYTVKMAVARTKATDQEKYRNPLLVDEKIKGCAKAIFNKEISEIAAEWNKCNTFIAEKDAANSLDMFDQLMTAQGTISTNVDGTAFGVQWLVCTPDYFRKLKKDLKNNVLVEYDMINGKRYPIVGGIPVKVSDGVKGLTHTVGSGESAVTYDVDAFLVDSTAVKVFRGKSVSAESSRNADTATDYYYARDNYVTAIEFKDRAVGLYGAVHQA